MTSDHTACIRINHAEYIELYYKTRTRQAIDELCDHLADLVVEANQNAPDPAFVFVNSADVDGTLPLAYIIQSIHKRRRDYHLYTHAYLALTFGTPRHEDIVLNTINFIAGDTITIRTFGINAVDDARQWLTQIVENQSIRK